MEQAVTFPVIVADFETPLFAKYNDTKHYCLLITCAVIRNIHLEPVCNLSGKNFVLAFKCFIA